jgi:hypothetical protein
LIFFFYFISTFVKKKIHRSKRTVKANIILFTESRKKERENTLDHHQRKALQHNPMQICSIYNGAAAYILRSSIISLAINNE